LPPTDGGDLGCAFLVGEHGGEHAGKHVAVRVTWLFGAMDADHSLASRIACRTTPTEATGVPKAQVIETSDETWVGNGKGPGQRAVFGRTRSDGGRRSDACEAAGLGSP